MALFEPHRSLGSEEVVGSDAATRALSVTVVENDFVAHVYENLAWFYDLVFGPADFDVQVGGQPVLDERERGHMRDVRTVFSGLWLFAAVALVILLGVSRRADRRATWGAVRRGAVGLGLGVVGLAVVAFVAFDALFEAFHQVLFPAGSYDFDPATERLVQLFPFDFWQETAIVVGAVILVATPVVAVIAGRRLRLAPSRNATAADLAVAAGTNP